MMWKVLLFCCRIYVKRVKKFPQFAVNPRLDKKSLHIAMAKSFQLLKEAGMNAPGVERSGS